MNNITRMINFLIKYAQWITFLGGLITILGGYLSYKKSEIESKNTSDKIDLNNKKAEENIKLTLKVKELTDANNVLIRSNVDIANNNSVLVNKNLELTAQISNTTSKTKEYLSGAKSYCFIGLFFTTKNDDESANLRIHTIGKNPLQDVYINVYTDDDISNNSNSLFNTEGKNFHIDVIQPNMMYTLRDSQIHLNKKRKTTITYVIRTNGGSFYQVSTYEYLNHDWVVHNNLQDKKTNRLIFKN
jgi:hypothetical protein